MKIKSRLLIFVSAIAFIFTFSLITPKTKAQELYVDYDAIVNAWETTEDPVITIFWGTPGYTVETLTYYIEDITVENGSLVYPEVGTKLDIISKTSTTLVVRIVKDTDDYLGKIDLIDNATYRYIETKDNFYYLTKDYYFYKIPVGDITFNNTRSGEVEFTTTLKEGNIYQYSVALGEVMMFNDSYDYREHLMLSLIDETAYESYRQGREFGYAEGYPKGKSDGYTEGYDIAKDEWNLKGYNRGWNNGYNQAVDDIASNGEYQAGYNKGLSDGKEQKVLENQEKFYDGIEKWLVPSIIVVLVAGGFLTFRRKREE